MPVLNTNLNIRLTDGVSGPAKIVARSLVGIKDAALGLNGKSFGTGLVEPLRRAEVQMTALSTRMRAQARALRGEVDGLSHGMHGLGAALAGLGIGHGMKEFLGTGADINKELIGLQNAGRTLGEVAEGFKAANAAMRSVPGSALKENLKILNETTGAFGDFHHALENLNFNVKLGSVMKSAFGDKLGDEGKAFNDLVRAFEIRGTASNPALFQKEAGQLFKAMSFTRGNVNPAEFLLFAQQANPAIKNLSERFLTKIAPSLIQELGGDRAGTALTAFRGTIMGKVRDKTQTAAWVKAGLLDPKMLVGGNGSPIAWRAGAVKGTNLALSDPLQWAETIALPALLKSGVNINNQMALTKQLGVMFRNTNAGRFAEAIMQANDRRRLHKDEGLILQTPDVDQQLKNNLSDLWTVTHNVQVGFENLFAALSKPLIRPITRALVELSNVLAKTSAYLNEHPLLAKKLGLAASFTGAAAGVTALRASIRLLGLAGLNPLKIMKAALLDFGAYAIGGGARAIGALRRGFLMLLNPIALVRGGLIGLRTVGRSLMAVGGLGAFLLASDFAVNNWRGIASFFKTFGETLRTDFAGSSGTTKAVVDGLAGLISKLGDITKEIPEEKWKAWGKSAADAVHGAVVQLENEDWEVIGEKIGKGLVDGILKMMGSLGDQIRTLLPGGMPATDPGGPTIVPMRGEHPHSLRYGYGTHNGGSIRYGGHLGAYSPPITDDRDLGIRTLYGEAGREGAAGMEAVGHVLKNRAMAGKFGGNSIGGVIRKYRQFSLWNVGDPAGRRARALSPNSPEYKAAADAYDRSMFGSSKDPTGGATHYYNPGIAHPNWGDPDHQTRIGRHVFQKSSAYSPTIHIHVAGDLHESVGDKIAKRLHEHYESAMRASYADTQFG